ncbi:hypothetical protein [Oceanibaculum pacificum]|uniref:Uncharacterized protein n=1 Tax=Oceanibaculum pacificum TaxID=580166 RepID=A0A154WG05_9PROT|nr:hypothetical protein [Oceanibaculum pacificum]KZD12439.1 hypothetical protein AUP43_04600 [Oceanibaculum pacificum]
MSGQTILVHQPQCQGLFFLIAGFHQNLAIPDWEMLVQKTDAETFDPSVANEHGSNIVEASPIRFGNRCDIVDVRKPLVSKRKDGHLSSSLSFTLFGSDCIRHCMKFAGGYFAMQGLANKWRQADAREDILQSARDFHQAAVERETRARECLERMKVEDVPNGIRSCLSRGGRILGLPLDNAFLGTHALSAFLEWCDNHDLRAFIEVQNRDQALLLIAPKECR